MSASIKSYQNKSFVVQRRLAAISNERELAKKERRQPKIGIGGWAALDVVQRTSKPAATA